MPGRSRRIRPWSFWKFFKNNKKIFLNHRKSFCIRRSQRRAESANSDPTLGTPGGPRRWQTTEKILKIKKSSQFFYNPISQNAQPSRTYSVSNTETKRKRAACLLYLSRKGHLFSLPSRSFERCFSYFAHLQRMLSKKSIFTTKIRKKEGIKSLQNSSNKIGKLHPRVSLPLWRRSFWRWKQWFPRQFRRSTAVVDFPLVRPSDFHRRESNRWNFWLFCFIIKWKSQKTVFCKIIRNFKLFWNISREFL